MICVELIAGFSRSDIDAPNTDSIASRAAETSALEGERRMKNPNSRSTNWLVASTEEAFKAASISENTPLPGANSPISTVSPDKGTDPCTVAPLYAANFGCRLSICISARMVMSDMVIPQVKAPKREGGRGDVALATSGVRPHAPYSS